MIGKHNMIRTPKVSVPLFIADRVFHAPNVFAHVIERHGFFLIRATDVKMQRLVGKDLPADEFPMEEIKNLYHLLASEQ